MNTQKQMPLVFSCYSGPLGERDMPVCFPCHDHFKSALTQKAMEPGGYLEGEVRLFCAVENGSFVLPSVPRINDDFSRSIAKREGQMKEESSRQHSC